MTQVTKDTRYVHGVGCTWSGPVQDAGKTKPEKVNGRGPYSLPCCPHCGSMLMELPNREAFVAGIPAYEATHPGYTKLWKWSEGKCFPNMIALTLAYNKATGASYPLPDGLKYAKLVAHDTKDGTSFIYDTVPLGKLYIVNVETKRTHTFRNVEKMPNVTTERECYDVLNDDGTTWGIMPSELIEILN